MLAIPSWIADMLPPGFERHEVPVGDGLHMHALTYGPADAPTLYMQHGNPTWSFLYRKVVAELAGERLRIVLPDMIGLGFSSQPRDLKLHQLENHIRWMRTGLDALGVQDCIFVGQDWGGPIGAGVFLDRPDQLKGLVVLNTVLSPPKPGFKPTFFHRLSQTPLISDILFRGFEYPQRMLGFVQGDKESITTEITRAYRWPLRGKNRNRVAPLALARMVPNGMHHPSVAPLTQIKAMIEAYKGPAEIVWGPADPILGRVLRRTQRMLPQAQTTETQAGHFIQEESPTEIAAAIRRVVQAVQQA